MKKTQMYWRTARTLSAGWWSRIFLFIALLSVPLRKKIMSRRPYKIKLYFQEKYFDFYIRDSADIAALTEVFTDLEYQVELSNTPRHIVDLGSHVGTSVAYFALQYPEALIVAYEADSDNFALLCSNMAQFPNVSCVHAAVAPAGGTVTFYKHGSSISSSLLDRGTGKALTVPAITLGDILKGNIDLIKFDIEGAEYEVFAAAPDLSRCGVFIGEVHYDLMGKTKEEFLKLFRNRSVSERVLNPRRSIVILK